MLKKLVTLVTSLVLMVVLSITAFAEDNNSKTYDPFDEQSVNQYLKSQGKAPVDNVPTLEEVNSALKKAKDKINDKIDKKTKGDIHVVEKVGSGKVSITVKKDSNKETDVVAQAYQAKDVDVKIEYDDPAGNYWYLQTKGTFMYGPDSSGDYVVDNYSGSCKDGARYPYSSENTKCEHESLDPSWVKSYNTAKYTSLKYGAAYHGYITVSMYGTGNYIVDEAYFDY